MLRTERKRAKLARRAKEREGDPPKQWRGPQVLADVFQQAAACGRWRATR